MRPSGTSQPRALTLARARAPAAANGLMTLGATLTVLRWVKRMALHLGRGELLWDTASAPCLLRHLYLLCAASLPEVRVRVRVRVSP